MTPLSVLDLSLITEGGDAATALANTRNLAQHAEAWGYRRYWVAEHHNMPGIASAATAVVIGYVASGTSTIRVGAGGIMRLVWASFHLWSWPARRLLCWGFSAPGARAWRNACA